MGKIPALVPVLLSQENFPATRGRIARAIVALLQLDTHDRRNVPCRRRVGPLCGVDDEISCSRRLARNVVLEPKEVDLLQRAAVLLRQPAALVRGHQPHFRQIAHVEDVTGVVDAGEPRRAAVDEKSTRCLDALVFEPREDASGAAAPVGGRCNLFAEEIGCRHESVERRHIIRVAVAVEIDEAAFATRVVVWNEHRAHDFAEGKTSAGRHRALRCAISGQNHHSADEEQRNE